MSNWYVAADGASLGPFTLEQLQDDLASGRHTPATLVWRDGFADWLPAGQVPELQPGAQPQAPPLLAETLRDAYGYLSWHCRNKKHDALPCTHDANRVYHDKNANKSQYLLS